MYANPAPKLDPTQTDCEYSLDFWIVLEISIWSTIWIQTGIGVYTAIRYGQPIMIHNE